MHVQVGIIGVGPAGLLLARMLSLQGISCVILEVQTRAYVEGRIRAGLQEQGSVDLLTEVGLAERLHKEALVHDAVEIVFDGVRHRIDLHALTGKHVYIYGQHEIVVDMIAMNLAAGVPMIFEAEATALSGLEEDRATINYRHAGEDKTLTCDYIAGCNGFHGLARDALPARIRRVFDRVYPYAWLGILAQATPVTNELIYCHHPSGFALFSMRSPEISRCYLQVPPDEKPENWSDDRIWTELQNRLGTKSELTIPVGPIIQKGVTGMRSFVCEPMQYGRLFLAGDAAHIVPPTGAKGMNLAFADIYVLANALTAFYKNNTTELLARYSEMALKRVWRAEYFSWWMTSMLHIDPTANAFDQKRQIAELHAVFGSEAGQKLFAQNYVGLPFGM